MISVVLMKEASPVANRGEASNLVLVCRRNQMWDDSSTEPQHLVKPNRSQRYEAHTVRSQSGAEVAFARNRRPHPPCSGPTAAKAATKNGPWCLRTLIWLRHVSDWRFMVEKMQFSPTKQYEKAKARGSREFLAGKDIEDNPFLHNPDKALSSWWQTGFLQTKTKESR